MDVRVRPAEAGDLAALYPLVAALAGDEGDSPPHPTAFARTFERSLAAAAPFRFVVAESRGPLALAGAAGQVVGCMSLHTHFSTWKGRPVVEVQDLYVVPDARRKGVASALLAHAEAHARRIEAARLDLQVLVDNPAARALYRRAGFQDSGYSVYRKPVARDTAGDDDLRNVF